MSARRSPAHLSRRERQILDTLYQRGPAGVAEIQAALPKSPGYSAVRALLRILEEKGHVKQAMATLLDVSAGDASPEELNRMAGLIDKARKEGK
jgi:BlaI family penicillinase repressor